MMIRRVAFRVSGRVQGVGYRASAAQAARGERLVGWVRNRADGDVEGEAEGDGQAIARFLAWCQTGPRAAHVTDLDVEDLPPGADDRSFEIRH